MEKLFKEFEFYLNRPDKKDAHVSAKGIYWHLDHALRVISGIIKLLNESKPADYQYNFNLKRSYIFLRGSIPRGKGRAPKGVVSDSEISEKELRSQLLKAKMALDKCDNLSRNSHFNHPYFGMLNKKQSLKFIKIHTQHHLKIVRDIKTSQTKKPA